LKGLLIRWLVSVVALYITIYTGKALGLGLGVKSIVSAFIAVLVLAVVNATIRPILKLAAAPMNCMTLGIVGILINVLMFWLVSAAGTGLVVKGFLAALYGSVVMGLVGGALNTLVRRED
jgi:putative membrane protein